jgi:restriction system protein
MVGAKSRAAAERGEEALKLKMAPNSLFAILLRSPWWASLGVAAALALLMRLLLPEKYVFAGMLGTFPFVAIAAVAAWKQARAPRPRDIEAALEQLRALGTDDLLAAAERAWSADGYRVQRHDGNGADLALERAGRRELISLRRWKAASTGIEPLRALHAACGRSDDAAGVYVHAGEVSDKARDFAKAQGLRLMPAAEFAQRIARSGALPAAGR